MKNNLKCSIVIRTHNHKNLLKRLLGRIEKQKKVLKPEIVIIDSSSTDGTREFALGKGCNVIKIDPNEFNHAFTFNLGAKKSKENIIVYASVDIIPKDGLWLYHLIKHFNNKKVAGVFSKQEPIPNFNLIEEFKLKKIFPKNNMTLANFSNASGAIRKSLWKKIKYDENVPYKYIGGEDQKFAQETKKKGYKIIYEPKSTVYHSHKYPLKTRLKSAYFIELNREKVDKWNKNVAMLNYKKRDLVFYLLKKCAFKSLFIDLLFGGILMRFYAWKGRRDKKKN